MDLTKEDLNILIEALDSWLNRDFGGEIIGDMLGSLLAKDEEGKKKILEEREERKKVKETQKQNEAEIATLLKAKLILMKQKIGNQ